MEKELRGNRTEEEGGWLGLGFWPKHSQKLAGVLVYWMPNGNNYDACKSS